MGLFLKMGFRNLTRNLRRTLTTGVTLCIGIVAMIFLRGLIDGIELDVCSLIVKSSFSHFKLNKDGYSLKNEEDPLAILFYGSSELVSSF